MAEGSEQWTLGVRVDGTEELQQINKEFQDTAASAECSAAAIDKAMAGTSSAVKGASNSFAEWKAVLEGTATSVDTYAAALEKIKEQEQEEIAYGQQLQATLQAHTAEYDALNAKLNELYNTQMLASQAGDQDRFLAATAAAQQYEAQIASLDMAIQQDNAQIEASKEQILSLNEKYASVAANAKALGDALAEQGTGAQAATTALVNETNAVKQTGQAHDSARTKLRQMREELRAMEEAGQRGTAAYNKLAQEAGTLADQIGDAQKQVQILADDQRGFKGVIQAANGAAGAFSAVQGAMALVGGESEEVQQAMLKMQSIMAVTTGLQQVEAALNKDSYVQLVLVKNAKDMLTAANARLATALGISTAAAQALMAALTIGLSVAITAIVVAMDKMLTKAQENAKAQQELSSKTADGAAEVIVKYNEMQQQYDALGDDMEAKKKYIEQNQDAFHNLGISVSSVADAEKVFHGNTKAVCDAAIARARALAAEQMAVEQYKEVLKLQDELDRTPKQVAQYNGGMGNYGSGQAQMVDNSAYIKKKAELDAAQKKADDLIKLAAESQKKSASILDNEGIERYTGNAASKTSTSTGGARKTSTGGARKTSTGSGRASNKKKTKAQMQQDIKAVEDAQKQLLEENAKAREDMIRNLAFAITTAEIDARKEGHKKVIGQMRSEFDKEQFQLEEQKRAAIEAEKRRIKAEFDAENAILKARGKKQMAWNDDMYNTREGSHIGAINAGYDQLAGYTRQKHINEAAKAIMKPYENETEKADDTIRAYEEDIIRMQELIEIANEKDALGNAEVVNQLKAKIEAAKTYIDIAKKQNEIDYLEKYGSREDKRTAIGYKQQLALAGESNPYKIESIKEQYKQELAKLDMQELQESINWEGIFGNLDGMSEAWLVAAREQVKGLMDSDKFDGLDATDKKTIVDAYNKISDAILEQKSAIGGLREAQQQFAIAQEQEQVANDNYTQAINELTIAQEQLNNARNSGADEATIQANSLKVAKAKANVDEKQKAVNAAKNNTKALDVKRVQASKRAWKELAKTIQGSADIFEELGEIIGGTTAKIMSAASEISKSALSMINGITQLAKASVKSTETAATGAANAISTAEKASVILTVISAAMQAISSLFNLFSGSNMDNMEDIIDENTSAIKDLSGAIDELKETIASNTGDDAVKAYEKAIELTKAQEKAASNAMVAEANKWEKGSHSINSQLNSNDQFKAYLDQVSKILGKRVTTSQQYLSLTAKQLEDVRTADINLFEGIQSLYRSVENDHTGSGIDEMINDKIDQYKDAYDELGESLTKSLTGLEFDSLQSDWEDLLSSMDASGQDFADNMEQYLRNAISSSIIKKQYATKLQELTEDFTTMMGDGTLTDTEAATIKERYKTLYDDAMAKVKSAYEAAGIGDLTDQDFSSKGVGSMSEETANELNGRFAALQISGQTIANCMQEMQGYSLQGLDHLAQIERHTAYLPQMYATLQNIEYNTNGI